MTTFADAPIRVLLAGSLYHPAFSCAEIDSIAGLGADVQVNTFHWPEFARVSTEAQYRAKPAVSFECFDPDNAEMLIEIIRRDSLGFDAMICPAHLYGMTEEVLRTATERGLFRRLRAIGVPNDSTQHLEVVRKLATELDIAIIHTPGVHAISVAEYTLGQICFHSRRLAHFYAETGKGGEWPHSEAALTTHLVTGKTLGVLGGSGNDGAAVTRLALRLGLRVIAIGSGSESGERAIRELGATVATNLEALLRESDFLSVNCRKTEETTGLLGARQIEAMKPGVIIVDPAGAEIFDRTALVREFMKDKKERRIEVLILDMPFGGKRHGNAFRADLVNSELQRLGVLFTPRMAGYTVESHLRAVRNLADSLERFVRHGDYGVPIANSTGRRLSGRVESASSVLVLDMIHLARAAAHVASVARERGLQVAYNADGSPTTNADVAAETLIKDGLRERGYVFRFQGEESREEREGQQALEIIVDGIDGTRNFRDGNYGWCVSIAARRENATVAAVVHDPYARETYYAEAGRGAFRLQEEERNACVCPPDLPPDFSYSVGSFRVAGSTVIKGQISDELKKLGGRGREWGCVALSICAVARGGLGTFIQGNSKIHDHVAALLIAHEAGAATQISAEGQRGEIDVIVSHPAIHQSVVEIFRRCVGRG